MIRLFGITLCFGKLIIGKQGACRWNMYQTSVLWERNKWLRNWDELGRLRGGTTLLQSARPQNHVEPNVTIVIFSKTPTPYTRTFSLSVSSFVRVSDVGFVSWNHSGDCTLFPAEMLASRCNDSNNFTRWFQIHCHVFHLDIRHGKLGLDPEY